MLPDRQLVKSVGTFLGPEKSLVCQCDAGSQTVGPAHCGQSQSQDRPRHRFLPLQLQPRVELDTMVEVQHGQQEVVVLD